MSYNFFGKNVRGYFSFPSGVVATNADTMRLMAQLIPQIGFIVGKSTTLQPRDGNKEDIFETPTPESGWNAVGYANPGLEVTVQEFKELREAIPSDVALMPQIGESTSEGFAKCARAFDSAGVADALELNVSCPHAEKGGILIGSSPQLVGEMVAATREATDIPLVVKLNAGVSNLEEIAKAAESAGARGISAINTLGGPNPELTFQYGGLSGEQIFPVTYDTIKRLRNVVSVPMIVMGGISNAHDVRKLEEIDNFFFCIGTALSEMSTYQIVDFYAKMEEDLNTFSSHRTIECMPNKEAHRYMPFIVKEVEELDTDLRLLRFYEHMDAEAGQFVMLKVGTGHAKPFSVASSKDGLELVVRRLRWKEGDEEKTGHTTSEIFKLNQNNVVRIRGPYGQSFYTPDDANEMIYVGAGCGIAPIHHAAERDNASHKTFIIGAKKKEELSYLDSLRKMGEVHIATEDGSMGYKGRVTDMLKEYMLERGTVDETVKFFNCGPEVVLAKVDKIQREHDVAPSNIYHLIERMTSCGVGICGKCSTPEGYRMCVDGPVFTAEKFEPGKYHRNKSGQKVSINGLH